MTAVPVPIVWSRPALKDRNASIYHRCWQRLDLPLSGVASGAWAVPAQEAPKLKYLMFGFDKHKRAWSLSQTAPVADWSASFSAHPCTCNVLLPTFGMPWCHGLSFDMLLCLLEPPWTFSMKSNGGKRCSRSYNGYDDFTV